MSEDNAIDPSVVPAAIESTESPSVDTGATPSESSVDSTSVPTHSDKPAGYNPIDPQTATPEQTKDRLDYLYGQVKHSEREKREMNRILAEQSRIINELSEGQKAVVTHLTERSNADTESQLKTQMQEAWKRQDTDSYIDAQTKLQELYAQKAVAKQTPQQQKQNNQMPASASEVAERAMQGGEINQEEYRMTEQWQSEKDESGHLLRPWAYKSDPNYQAALFESRSVMANPRFSHLSYPQKLEEIDRRMGTQKRTASQAVIGGSLTKPGKNAKLQLTPKQREIALKTQYAGKGKSEAEHLDKYRQQIEKFQQRRAK